jgi:hypothetical protein
MRGMLLAGTIKEYAVRPTFRILTVHILLHLLFYKNKLSVVKINVIFHNLYFVICLILSHVRPTLAFTRVKNRLFYSCKN